MICGSREFFSLSNALKIIKSFDLVFNGNLIGRNSDFKLIPFDHFSVVRNRVAETTFIVRSRLHRKILNPSKWLPVLITRALPIGSGLSQLLHNLSSTVNGFNPIDLANWSNLE